MTEVEMQEAAVKALKNEWGKEFTLGKGDAERKFEIKDLPYYDYVEFVQLVRPMITVVADGVNMTATDGEFGVGFDATAIDFDKLISLCGKELPRMAYLVCRQSDPKIKEIEVALLAARPQRLIEVVILQIMHNKMIEEFASFFTRLTAMVSTMIPDAAKLVAPMPVSQTEETPSSS